MVDIVGIDTRSLYLPLESIERDIRPIMRAMLKEVDTLPYTEEQERVFRVARQSLSHCKMGLSLLGYSFIVLVPALLTLCALGIIEKNEKSMVATAIVAVIISNVASMCFTGTLPDRSSDWQNADQDEMYVLKKRFDDFGLYLLLEYKRSLSREELIQDAREILAALPEKERVLMQATTQKGCVLDTFSFLRNTLTYITCGRTNFDSALEMQIECLNLPIAPTLEERTLQSVV